jgi:hypothetical protein
LREISEIGKMIASGNFFPDQSRSRYFIKDNNLNFDKAQNMEPSLQELRGDSSSETLRMKIRMNSN